MTNNQLNRERLEKIKSWRETYGAGSNVMLPAEEAEELARIALAAMDSEPVAEVVSIYGDPEAFGEREIRPLVGIQQMPYGTKLYRHAQQPVVPDDVLAALQKVARIRLDLNDFDGDRRGIADCLGDAEEALIEVVNRRAAMLHAGNSPAQSDCCPAQNGNSPAQHADRPVAWHHTAKCKDENHSTCCFSYSPTHDFGPWYEKPQSQPHYLPERLDYDRALHFLSTEPRKVTLETVIGGNSPAIPDGYVMVPKDLLSELRDWAQPEIEKYCEMWEGRRDSEFPALRKVIADADALLATAHQEVKDVKAN